MNDQFSYGLDAFYEGGPKTWNQAFPPVCVKSHWDSTQITRHVLPSHLMAPLQFDPRPSTKICTSYYTLSETSNEVPEYPAWEPSAKSAELQNTFSKSTEDSLKQQFVISEPDKNAENGSLFGPSYFVRPLMNTSMTAVPPGGAAGKGAPYTLYANAVGQESELYRLDEPLTKCKDKRYTPKDGPADANNTLPYVSQEFGLSPYATYVSETSGCRQTDDDKAWNRSGRLFFNHTRLDRINPKPNGPLACGNDV